MSKERFQLCDGSWIEFEPIYELADCDECGSYGLRLSNEPAYHDDGYKWRDDWYCRRCNELLVSLRHVQLVFDKIRPAVEKAMQQPNPMYRYIRSR